MLSLSEPAFTEPALISPPVWDIAEDTDQDGLRDVDELLMFGMEPLDPSDGLSDDDADLLSMAWEIFHETDPDLADTDGDAWTDSEELLFYGTDPLDPQSFPQGFNENGQKTTEDPSSSATFASQPTAALVQTPPPPSLSNGEFNDLAVTNFRHNTGKDYQGKVFDWGSSAGDTNGWIAYNGSLIEVWKSGDERFIELDGWKEHFGVKQPIANVAAGSYVLTWQQSGRTNAQAFDNAYKVQVYYLKNGSEVKIAETGYIAGIDKTKWTPNALGFSITAEQIADANGSPIYVAFIPKNNNTYGTLIDKVALLPVEVIELSPKLLDESNKEIDESEKPVTLPKYNEMIEEITLKNQVEQNRIAHREMKIRITGGKILAGKSVTWTMNTWGVKETDTVRGDWKHSKIEKHQNCFEESKVYGLYGYKLVDQKSSDTKIEAMGDDGYTAIRANLPPIGWNHAEIKIKIEGAGVDMPLIRFIVPAVIVIDPGHGGDADIDDKVKKNDLLRGASSHNNAKGGWGRPVNKRPRDSN